MTPTEIEALERRVCGKVGITSKVGFATLDGFVMILPHVASDYGPWTGKMIEWLRKYHVHLGPRCNDGSLDWTVFWPDAVDDWTSVEGDFLMALCLAIDAIEA